MAFEESSVAANINSLGVVQSLKRTDRELKRQRKKDTNPSLKRGKDSVVISKDNIDEKNQNEEKDENQNESQSDQSNEYQKGGIDILVR